MFSQSLIVPFLAALTLAACSGKNSSGKEVDLLTSTPWKYEKAGFNSTDEGDFDALDPRIAGNEKDNAIVFRKDGTGYSQVSLKGKGGPDSLPFIWSLQNKDSTIYFRDTYYKVKVLSKHKLEMYADEKIGNDISRYTIILSH